MLSDLTKNKTFSTCNCFKAAESFLFVAVLQLSKGKMSSCVMESWRIKQKSSYVGHFHPKYLALTTMEVGISREASHKLLWLVNASGVLRSFTGNTATIYLSEKDKSILPLEQRTPFTGPEPTADSAGFCICTATITIYLIFFSQSCIHVLSAG